jgi:hypothetical protein
VDCKDGSSGQTTTFYGVGDQSTSDSVITNSSLVIVNCLRASGNSIIHMLPTNIRILTCCCISRTPPMCQIIGIDCGVLHSHILCVVLIITAKCLCNE